MIFYSTLLACILTGLNGNLQQAASSQSRVSPAAEREAKGRKRAI